MSVSANDLCSGDVSFFTEADVFPVDFVLFPKFCFLFLALADISLIDQTKPAS